jgi:tripartite-type tricarboxylate transporter receptor subunit TctC
MKRLLVFVMATAAAMNMIVLGCAQAQPAPAPTQPAAAPTKAAAAPTTAPVAQPTTAPAAQPSAAPAKAIDFPAKGKSITVIVPYDAGGATDIATRLIASLMEKDLGVPVQVVDKPGAGSQVGVTELSLAKPDGYTIGVTAFPAVITTYLDPTRKASFSRKSFEPVGNFMVNPVVSSVAVDSPYKTLKEVIDAAKANPGKIRAGTTGILGPSHLGLLMLQKATGIELATVHFTGGAPEMTAVLGGHIDMADNIVPEVLSPNKSGQIRPLGVMDTAASTYLSGIKTFTEQGYPVVSTSPVGVSAPAGTPKEIVSIIADSMKKATNAPEFKSKMTELGYMTLVPDPADYAKFWDDSEAQIKPLMDLAAKETAAQ